MLCAGAWGAAGVAETRARLDALDAELEGIEAWLLNSSTDRETLSSALRASDQAIAEIARARRNAELRVADTSAEAGEIRARMRALETARDEQLDALRTQMRATWMLARREPLQMLLEAESPDRVGRLIYFNRHLAEAREEQIERWQAEGRLLATQASNLEAALTRLEAERDALSQRSSELEAGRRQRGTTLANLEARIRDREDNAEELRATRAELGALLDRLMSEVQRTAGPAFKDARGQLPWPAAPRLLQTFGRPRPPGNLPAQGVLIGADSGTPIQAVAAGEVVFADWLRGFGLLAVVDHGDGYMSLYGQLESLIRKVGDRVEAGEQLATAGSSGGSARSGVWFEVRNQGKPEDPVNWCKPRGTG